MRTAYLCAVVLFVAALTLALTGRLDAQRVTAQVRPGSFDEVIAQTGNELFTRGAQIFRFDTFGDERFWSDGLKLHLAIAGGRLGGIGPGLSPAGALGAGLKVDVDMVPPNVLAAMRAGTIDLNDPANTQALIAAKAVVGVMPIAGRTGQPLSVGFTCSLCHTNVDNSFAPGIGSRLDGWPNRDLNVGKIVALSPALTPTQKAVYNSWGPGKYDPRFNIDGK